MSNALISSPSGIVEVKTGTNLQLTDTPTNDNQAGNITYLKSLFQAAQYLGGLANVKVSLSSHTLTLTTNTGSISSTNPMYIAIPLAGSSGSYDYRTITSSLTLTVPSGTVNQRVSGINTTDGSATFASSGAPTGTTATGIEWFLYYVFDASASALGSMIGISRSPLHTHVPVNYFHTVTASTITAVSSAATAWDAMILGCTGAITTVASATCVCLGSVMTATVDGSSTTAGRFSSETLTTDFLPRWNNKNSMANVRHEVRVDTANGFGSTDNKIRKFTNNTVNAGTAIQYFSAGGTTAASSVGGAEFLLTEDGLYMFTYTENASAGATAFGLSVNSTQRTTSVASITLANILTKSTSQGANNGGSVSYQGYFSAGDIVRPHTAGSAGGTDVFIMTASKIGWKINV